MAVISVRLPDSEYHYAEQFAKFNGVKLSVYLRELLEKQIEDFEDEQMLKELEKDMQEHPENYKKTYTLEEIAEELGF